MKYSKFIEGLQRTITEEFIKVSEEDIYEFGICTDSDTMTIVPCYNTFEYFAEELKNNFLTFRVVSNYLKWEIHKWEKD